MILLTKLAVGAATAAVLGTLGTSVVITSPATARPTDLRWIAPATQESVAAQQVDFTQPTAYMPNCSTGCSMETVFAAVPR